MYFCVQGKKFVQGWLGQEKDLEMIFFRSGKSQRISWLVRNSEKIEKSGKLTTNGYGSLQEVYSIQEEWREERKIVKAHLKLGEQTFLLKSSPQYPSDTVEMRSKINFQISAKELENYKISENVREFSKYRIIDNLVMQVKTLI